MVPFYILIICSIYIYVSSVSSKTIASVTIKAKLSNGKDFAIN